MQLMLPGKSYNGVIHGIVSIQESVNRDPVSAIVVIVIVTWIGKSLVVSRNKPHVV